MDGPCVRGADGGGVVPELGEQEQSTGCVGLTGIERAGGGGGAGKARVKRGVEVEGCLGKRSGESHLDADSGSKGVADEVAHGGRHGEDMLIWSSCTMEEERQEPYRRSQL